MPTRADECGGACTGTRRYDGDVSFPEAGRSARSARSATTISSGPSGFRLAGSPATSPLGGPSTAPDPFPPIDDDVEAGVPPERDRQEVEKLGIAARHHDQVVRHPIRVISAALDLPAGG